MEQHTCETSGCEDTFRPCSRCGATKPLTGFYRDDRRRHGHAYECKECNNTRRSWPHRCQDEGCDRRVRPCTKCGEMKTFTEYHKVTRNQSGHSSRCKVCVLDQKKVYGEKNREKLAARNKAWYEANKGHVADWSRSYYADNRETIRERDKERHAKKWAADPEYRARFHAAEIRRRRLLASAKQERYTREEICARDGWVCGICADPIDPLIRWPNGGSASIDHIMPVSLGGDDTKVNVRASHLACNLARGNRVDNHDQPRKGSSNG